MDKLHTVNKKVCSLQFSGEDVCLCGCHQRLTINQRPSGCGIAQLVAPCVITKLTFKQQQPYFILTGAGCRVVYGWSKSFQLKESRKKINER